MTEKCIRIHYCSPEPFLGHTVLAAALESSVRIYPPTPTTHPRAAPTLWVGKCTANSSLAPVSLF